MSVDYQKLIEEIRDSEQRTKAHIESVMGPTKDKVEGHQRTLYGPDGNAGLVGDVKGIKTVGKVLAIMFGSTVAAWIISKWQQITGS